MIFGGGDLNTNEDINGNMKNIVGVSVLSAVLTKHHNTKTLPTFPFPTMLIKSLSLSLSVTHTHMQISLDPVCH